jgi:polyisoprenoid-binding protein YceI
MRLAIVGLLAAAVMPSLSRAQGPIFTITPEQSDVKFFVKASVAIDGQFTKWDATLTFPSVNAESGNSTSKFMPTP